MVKTKVLQVRLSPDEMGLFIRMAEDCGLGVSAWLREAGKHLADPAAFSAPGRPGPSQPVSSPPKPTRGYYQPPF